MPAQFTKHFVQDLTQDIKIRQCGTIVFNADNESNVISVDLYNGTEEYSGGGSVAGACICPDGSTVALTGSIDGKTASVTLTGDCFAFPGQIGIGVQVISGMVKTTVLKAIYNVELFETDDVVDPGSRLTVSVADLVQDIADAIATIPADYTDLMAAVAPTFSTTATYNAGQYIWYDGKLYKFTTDHAAGSWTGTDATQVDLGNDLKNQIDNLEEGFDTVNDFSTIKTGTNIFPGYTESGAINNTTGIEYDIPANVRSGFIPVDASKGTLHILRQTAKWGMRLFFYDANEDFISPNIRIFTGSDTALSGTCAIPASAAYVRTYRDASVTSWVVLSYTEVDSYIEYTEQRVLNDGVVSENNLDNALVLKLQNIENDIDNLEDSVSDLSGNLEDAVSDLSADIESIENTITDLKNDLTDSETINIFDGTFPESGYFDADGVDASSASFERTNYIPVDATNSTLYVLRTAQPYILSYCFYTENGTGLGRATIFSGSDTPLTASISIPSTAKTIRLYTSISAYSGNLMLSYTEQSEYVPYGTKYVLADGIVSENNLDNALKEKINQAKQLAGKTIAFMGDSIIGNFYDSTGVCAQISELTGATVINCAFGGSRMAYEYSKWGDATPEATGYVEGATDAQKNQVDQYRYWNMLCGARLADAVATGTWTMQENAVTNMTGKFSYFAERVNMMKNLDWTTVDFIMWEYGTNDFMTNVALTGNDLFAYDYAYRHAIETILTAYPQIRIITATPMYRWYQSDGTFTDDSNTHEVNDYQNAPHKLTDFVETAQDTSKAYQIACIDDYYTLCANRYTRLAFFNSTDGTHPNAQGRSRLAEHIAAQLLSII